MPVELALAHLRGGRARDALELLDTRLAAQPDDAQALFVSALALEDLRRLEDALARYERTLAVAPALEGALHNRGLILARLGRLDEAERSHREYLAAYPASQRARMNLVDTLLAQSRYDEALVELEPVLRSAPGDVHALLSRGMALASLGRLKEATEAFSTARSADPSAVHRQVSRLASGTQAEVALSPENIFLWRQFVALSRCDWSKWQMYIERFRTAIVDPNAPLEPALAFAALHLPLSAQERLATARIAATSIERRSPALARIRPRDRNRLRVGILSPDFKEHLNAYLLLPLFELRDPERFEMWAYSLARDDGSTIRGRIRSAADRFVDLSGVSDKDAASRIRGDEVDILVDVGGYTEGARFTITAQRPAPIQAQYLAFPGSLGSSRVDYAICDKVIAPEGAEREWTEKLIHLPGTYYLYDFRHRVPELQLSRAEYGLPENAFVYCVFHKAQKITPDAFDAWMDILRSVPGSVLWFGSLPREAISNLRSAARVRAVDPERLHFAPFESRDRYLARQRLGNLMLDALHHNAMTTACDALSAGLPILTARGSTLAARAGESIARAANVPELVSPDLDAYVERAVFYGQHSLEAARLGEKLRAVRRTAPLFDTVARVRQLEEAFSEMHARARAATR